MREFVKLAAASSDRSELVSFNWGAEKGHNSQFKLVQQWLACSITGTSLHVDTSGDPSLAELPKLVTFIRSSRVRISVGILFGIMRRWEPLLQPQFFQFIIDSVTDLNKAKGFSKKEDDTAPLVVEHTDD